MVTVAVAMVRPLGIGRLLLQSAWTSWPRGITTDVRLMSSRRCDVNSVNSSRNGVGGGFGYARRVKLRGCLAFEIRACGLSSGGGEKGGKMKGDLILGIETSCDDTGAAVVMHFFPSPHFQFGCICLWIVTLQWIIQEVFGHCSSLAFDWYLIWTR